MELEEVEREITESVVTRTLTLRKTGGGGSSSGGSGGGSSGGSGSGGSSGGIVGVAACVEALAKQAMTMAMTPDQRTAVEASEAGVAAEAAATAARERRELHRVRIFQYLSFCGRGSPNYDLALRDLLRMHADLKTWQTFCTNDAAEDSGQIDTR